MKITVKSYNAVAAWRWNTKIANTPTLTTAGHQKGTGGDQAMKEAAEAEEEEGEEEEDDDDEDVCGICQVPYEGCCPNCKIPGDDCPLIFGKCTHIFHLHCLLTWLNSETSKNQCPMDRQPWVTAGQEG